MQADNLSNPAPLGLMGFGMTTILLNLHNAGLFPFSGMILAMGLCYGGVAQVIAGIMEFRKGNTFGTTAFTSYGLFWMSFVALSLFPGLETPVAQSTPPAFMACYLLLWGVFTLFMFFGSLKKTKALQFVFASLTLLFFLLAAKDFTGYASLGVFAGYEGIICGASAMYLAMADVINEEYGRIVLPVG
ncbi:acetate uptake transporter [Sansalvadorimonas verongulae]|uniref:acetate uptake transporter n=1 Tax=Sansalvadorimonas verongulae TaxID=2172824 RepID=UPI0012BB6E5D|nr:GPR1/FUN34/YaaH family transporter [Sansalvadorimonas verongulae]MTI11771.1 hypothetical protein [Sansalvadorimonas verongulae]